MDIAYLACPYSHPNPQVEKERLETVTRAAYLLMQKEIYVFSPLTHNLPIDRLGRRGNWQTWSTFDHEMLSRCDRLLVLKLPGWEESLGVAAEIAHAQSLGLPIEWLEPEEVLTAV